MSGEHNIVQKIQKTQVLGGIGDLPILRDCVTGDQPGKWLMHLTVGLCYVVLACYKARNMCHFFGGWVGGRRLDTLFRGN